jgi:hypothetical protein
MLDVRRTIGLTAAAATIALLATPALASADLGDLLGGGGSVGASPGGGISAGVGSPGGGGLVDVGVGNGGGLLGNVGSPSVGGGPLGNLGSVDVSVPLGGSDIHADVTLGGGGVQVTLTPTPVPDTSAPAVAVPAAVPEAAVTSTATGSAGSTAAIIRIGIPRGAATGVAGHLRTLKTDTRTGRRVATRVARFVR